MTLHVLLDRHAPSLGMLLMSTDPNLFDAPFPCVFLGTDRRDDMRVCQWGHPTSPMCPCCQGKAVPLLGLVLKSPIPFPNTTQVSINHHKASEVCAPLVLLSTSTCLRSPNQYHASCFIFLDSSPSILIQVDIGGHPPIPWAPKTFFHLGSFSAVFRVPNFWGRFEALNNAFWGFGAQMKD